MTQKTLNSKEAPVNFKRVFEALPGINVLINTDRPRFTVLGVTDGLMQTQPAGTKKEDLIGKPFFDAFPQNTNADNSNGRPNLLSSLEYVIDTGHSHDLPVQRYDVLDEEGNFTERYWSASNKPFLDEAGKVVYIIHSSAEITEKVKAANRELQIEEMDKAHNLFMQAPVAVCILSGKDYKVSLVNEGMLNLLGKSGEMIGKPISHTLTEANEQGLIAILDKVSKTHEPYHIESFQAVLLINGVRETRYFDLVFKPYQHAINGDESGIFCIGYNVTEQVLDRQKVREVTERLNYRNALFEAQNEATPDGVVVVDAEGKIVLYNNRFTKIWSIPPEVIKGENDEAALHYAMTMLKYPDAFIVRVNELYATRKEATQELIHFKDGRVIERDGTPIISEDGTYYGWAWYFRDITDRLTQEHRFRNILELAPDPIFILMGKDLVLDAANEPLFRIWNVDKSVIGKPFLEILPEMNGQVFPGLMHEVMGTGKPVRGTEVPAIFNRADGVQETRYFNFNYQPFPALDGIIAGVLALATDVTEQVHAKTKLEESERNFRNMILQSPVAMCIFKGQDLILQEANEPMYILWGRGEEELLHKPIFVGLPEAKAQGFEEILHNVFVTGEPFSASEVPINLPRNGTTETVYINFVYLPFRESDGSISGIMAVATDITAQVEARHKIEASEQEMKRFKFMADHAQDPFILMRGDGTFAYLNRKAIQAWGYTEEEAAAIRVPDVDPIYHDQKFVEAFEKAQHEGIPQFETLHKKKDGLIYPVEVNMGAVTIGGEPYLFAIARDITERQKTAKILEQSEARSRLAVEAARLGTFDIDVRSQTIIHSPRVPEIFGLPAGEKFPYNGFVSLVHPDDKAIRSAAHDKAMQTGELLYEARILLADKSLRWIRLNGKYTFENDTPVSLVGTVLDITEEKKAAELLEQKIEERTFELQRANEQLKQFTYAASHDLQEPLRKISFFLDRLFTGLEGSITEENKKIIDRIQHTTGRMRNLINDLLDYSNTTQGTTGFEEVDLNDVVNGVVDDMEATIIEQGATIHFETLPQVKGDERQLKQLFQNIISNGIKYSKKGVAPRIEIKSNLVSAADAKNQLPHNLEDATYYQIKVVDNGIGFDPDDAERIFRLFQRLHGKAEYEGTGVGLAIVQKVVENHGGYIWADGVPDEGSTFTVLLPVR